MSARRTRGHERPRSAATARRAQTNIDGQYPTDRRGDRNMIIDENLIPFHKQAEDHGTYVLAERARDADRARPEDPSDGPSENTD